MKKFLRILISTVMTLYIAFILFFNFVGGAPVEQSAAESYMIKAAIFSIALSGFGCACVNYILYLEKKLEEKELELQAKAK